jgi:hypothetical protein
MCRRAISVSFRFCVLIDPSPVNSRGCERIRASQSGRGKFVCRESTPHSLPYEGRGRLAGLLLKRCDASQRMSMRIEHVFWRGVYHAGLLGARRDAICRATARQAGGSACHAARAWPIMPALCGMLGEPRLRLTSSVIVPFEKR